MTTNTNPTAPDDLLILPEQWRKIWDEPEWRNLPYHSVQIEFSEGTIVHVPAEWLITHAAFHLQQHDVSWKIHMTRQIIPAVLEEPNRLIDFAKTLGWKTIGPLVTKAFYKSPAMLLEPRFKDAVITLSPFSFPEAR